MSISTRNLQPGGYAREASELPGLDDGPVDLRPWFEFAADEQRPMELEIGSGKGTFLIQQASQHPDVDYLGLEYARAYCFYAADRARRHGLNNVRLLHGEASSFIGHHVREQVFAQVHIYFPDPWPKARHHKRRLIQPPFLRRLGKTIITPSEEDSSQLGYVHLCTDHADYFAWMEQAVMEVSDLFERHAFMPPISRGEGELAGTNFERKYRREGRTFHGLTLRKRR